MSDKIKALMACGFTAEQAELLAAMAVKKAPVKKVDAKKTTKPDPVEGSYITRKGETIAVKIGQVAANGRRWVQLQSGKWFMAEEGRVSTAPFSLIDAPTTTTTTLGGIAPAKRGPGRPRKTYALTATTPTASVPADVVRTLAEVRRDLCVTKTISLTAAKAAFGRINADPAILEAWLKAAK